MTASPTVAAPTSSILTLDYANAPLSLDEAAAVARVLSVLRAQGGTPDLDRIETDDLAALYVGVVAVKSLVRLRIRADGSDRYTIFSGHPEDANRRLYDAVQRSDFLSRIATLLTRTRGTAG